MKEPFTVFYAWQSDHPGGQCRYLIAEALDAAAASISGDSSVPFQVRVDQDTQGVPGLCDIPATILAKIEKCDALVADLTYVAMSAAKTPRYCSNPNVLFEVGFAFRAITPERLILVMNERHGPVTDQIFDLDHRRHPIRYTYPGNGSRNKVVAKLAKDLEDAIRLAISLGPQSKTSAQATVRQAEELVSMRAELDELWGKLPSPATHYWDGAIYPLVHRQRWPGVVDVEKVVHARAARGNRRHEFPTQVKGNQRHNWGIANSMYGDPWVATKSGIFLYRAPMDNSGTPYPYPARRNLNGRPKPGIEPGKWVEIFQWRQAVLNLFEFAQNWVQEFTSSEEISVELSAPLEGLHLVARNTHLDRFVEDIEPAVAKEFRFVRRMSCETFLNNWTSICADAIDSFVELFPPPMGHEFPSSRDWVLSESS